MPVMLVMVAILLLLLWVLLQGLGWLLLVRTDPPIGRTAENRMLATVAVTKLLRVLKQYSAYCVSTSGMQSRKSSSMVPQLLWGCAISISAPLESILQCILMWILPILMAWTSVKEERKSVSRQHNTSVHALFTIRLMFLVLYWCCTPPPGTNSARGLTSHGFQDDRQSWMAVTVRAMNVWLIFSITGLSFTHMYCMP